MFCDARMDLERKFLAMFDAIASWKIAANTLQLLDAGGKSVATFETT
jgi:heat shock protein HslJ